MADQKYRIWFLLLLVFTIYLRPGAAVACPPVLMAAGEKYAVVTATTLNIRTEPSTRSSIVTKAAKGIRLEVIKEEGEWCKVKTEDGKTGWASKQYLDMTAAQKEAVAEPQEKAKPTTPPAPKMTKSRPESSQRSHAVGTAASFGVLGGVAFSQLAGEDISDEYSARFGYAGGALAYFPLSRIVGIQPELMYVMKGAVKNSGGTESTLQFDYVDLPILLRFTLPIGNSVSPYVTIGPLISYNIQAIVTDNSANGSDRKITDLKKLDYGVTASGGLQFYLAHQTFLIDARYYFGLAQIHDAETDPLDLKNNCLTVALAWMF